MSYYGDNGQIYDVSTKIAEGGVGIVYNVVGRDDVVAKIFKQRDRLRDDKIDALCHLKWTPDIEQYLVLPKVVLYEDVYMTRQCGFIMEKVDCSSLILDIYSEDHPVSVRKRVCVAESLCEALAAIHNNGGRRKGMLLMGDFNSKNISVDRYSGQIRIIDVDSFHLSLKKGGQHITLPCTELYPDFWMPELTTLSNQHRGADLKTLSQNGFETFTLYTDYYCLAYHLHMLLLGCTPFARKVDRDLVGQGSVRLPPAKIMSVNGQYSYVELPKQAKLPEFCPDFNILTPELQQLFIRAFKEGANDPTRRPSPEEFLGPIRKYLSDLTYCECKSWDHYLPSYWKKPYCEWCRVETITGRPHEINIDDLWHMTNRELLYFENVLVVGNDLKMFADYELGMRYAGGGHVPEDNFLKLDKRKAKKYLKLAEQLAKRLANTYKKGSEEKALLDEVITSIQIFLKSL